MLLLLPFKVVRVSLLQLCSFSPSRPLMAGCFGGSVTCAVLDAPSVLTLFYVRVRDVERVAGERPHTHALMAGCCGGSVTCAVLAAPSVLTLFFMYYRGCRSVRDVERVAGERPHTHAVVGPLS